MKILEFPLQPGKLADVRPFVVSIVARDPSGSGSRPWDDLSVRRELDSEVEVSWGKNDYCANFELLAVDDVHAYNLAIAKWARSVARGLLPDWNFVESNVRDGLFGHCFDDF